MRKDQRSRKTHVVRRGARPKRQQPLAGLFADGIAPNRAVLPVQPAARAVGLLALLEEGTVPPDMRIQCYGLRQLGFRVLAYISGW